MMKIIKNLTIVLILSIGININAQSNAKEVNRDYDEESYLTIIAKFAYSKCLVHITKDSIYSKKSFDTNRRKPGLKNVHKLLLGYKNKGWVIKSTNMNIYNNKGQREMYYYYFLVKKS